VINNSNAVIIATDFAGFYTDAAYQWQVSDAPGARFVNVVSGGTGRNFTPDIINLSSAPEVFFFRRAVRTAGIIHFSNYVTWAVTPALAFTEAVKNVSCFGAADGSITAIVVPGSGTGPYRFAVNEGSYLTTTTFPSLVPGSYTITVLDASGSTDTKTVLITQPDSVFLKISNPAAVSSPATVNLTSSFITAGSSPGLVFSYYADSLETLPISNPGSISVPGKYFIKGTSAGGCSASKPVYVLINKPGFIVTSLKMVIPTIFSPNATVKTMYL